MNPFKKFFRKIGQLFGKSERTTTGLPNGHPSRPITEVTMEIRAKHGYVLRKGRIVDTTPEPLFGNLTKESRTGEPLRPFRLHRRLTFAEQIECWCRDRKVEIMQRIRPRPAIKETCTMAEWAEYRRKKIAAIPSFVHSPAALAKFPVIVGERSPATSKILHALLDGEPASVGALDGSGQGGRQSRIGESGQVANEAENQDFEDIEAAANTNQESENAADALIASLLSRIEELALKTKLPVPKSKAISRYGRNIWTSGGAFKLNAASRPVITKDFKLKSLSQQGLKYSESSHF